MWVVIIQADPWIWRLYRQAHVSGDYTGRHMNLAIILADTCRW